MLSVLIPVVKDLTMSGLRAWGRGIRKKRIVLIVLCCLLLGLRTSASTVQDSLQFRIYFPVNSSVVKLDFLDNEQVMTDFSRTFNFVGQDKRVTGITLTVRGNASVEGPVSKSVALAASRAQAIADYLASFCSVPDTLINVLQSEPLRVEAKVVLSSYSEFVQGIDLEAMREITLMVDGSKIRQAFKVLDGKDDGGNWNWYKTHVLDITRFAEIKMVVSREDAIEEDVSAPELVVVTDKPAAKPQSAPVSETSPSYVESCNDSVCKRYILLKNNLLYDLGLVANIGVEFSIGRHFSFDLPLTFSPYNITSNFRIRTLTLQPGFRYWFGKDMSGLFASLYGNFGLYDVALCGKTRWQNHNNWKEPLYGGGAGVGYAKHFGKNKRWGLEFELGLGYAYLPSDCFYNVPNGALYGNYVKHYWGPTKANVGITYTLRQK